MPIIKPYNARVSEKTRIKIIPMNNLFCCALALTPASPTIPIASPAANELRPTMSPDDRWVYPEKVEYSAAGVIFPYIRIDIIIP